ncbi:MAG: adenosine kinase [Pseudomonadales bacterium]|nr:adenosine kinase [Pseudomonadales bacterium]
MKRFDVYGIGNALMDFEYRVSEAPLSRLQVDKGHMTLIDEQRLAELRNALKNHEVRKLAGGSAANTVFAVRGFGGNVRYSCSVAADATGTEFIVAMRSAGIVAPEPRDEAGVSGCCLVLVTPDAERSMNTFLGVSRDVPPTCIDFAALQLSHFLYVEGYLASSPTSVEAVTIARESIERSPVKTSITLSDVNVIRGAKAQMERLLSNGVDLMFCNEHEALAWCATDRLDIAFKELGDIADQVVVTLGSRGCALGRRRRILEVATNPVAAVDLNGAGDMFAGAFLACITNDHDTQTAASFANYAASRQVRTVGGRLPSMTHYAELWSEFGLNLER